MPREHEKFQLTFEFEVNVSKGAHPTDRALLRARFQEILGSVVFDGMRNIVGKRLEQVGMSLETYTHELKLLNAKAPGPKIAREAIIAAAPHLTDAEIEQLMAEVSARHDHKVAVTEKLLRRYGLQIAQEYRLAPCVVRGVLTSGKPAALDAEINLTNGHVIFPESCKSARLDQHAAPITVDIASGGSMPAQYSGYTLTGPVVDVPIVEMAPHRDQLISAWQAQAALA